MDGHAVFVLVEARRSMAPANVCAQLLRALGEELHKSGLLDGDHVILGIRRPRQIQRQSRKHGPRRRLWRFVGPCQGAVETSMVENPNPLAGNPVGARFRVGPRQRVQDGRADSGQSELAGQHQPIGAGAGDDDVIHLAQLTSAGA